MRGVGEGEWGMGDERGEMREGRWRGRGTENAIVITQSYHRNSGHWSGSPCHCM